MNFHSFPQGASANRGQILLLEVFIIICANCMIAIRSWNTREIWNARADDESKAGMKEPLPAAIFPRLLFYSFLRVF